MALEFCDGLDNHGANKSNQVAKWYPGSSDAASYSMSSTAGVQGGAAVIVSQGSSASFRGPCYLTKGVKGQNEDFYCAWWYKPTLLSTNTARSRILILTNLASLAQASTDSALNTSSYSELDLHLLPSGYLEVRLNDTVLATGTTTQLALNDWYYLQVRVRVDGTSGEFEVRVGATTEISYSGSTFSGSGTKGILAVIHSTSPSSGANSYYVDDPIYFTGAGDAPNTFFSSPMIISQRQPSGAGSITQGTPSTGANYTCVDEVPPNTTDYVDFASVGDADTYAFAPLGGGTGIVAVVVNTVCRTTGTTNRKYKGRCKSGASVGYGPEVEGKLNNAYYTQQSPVAVDPATGSAWSGYAAVDAAEFGLEVTV